MLPILIAIGPLKIYTMGVFVVLGFFWSFFLLWKLIKLTSFKEEDVFDIVFLGILTAFIGARLLYVILRNNLFGFNLIKIIFINGYPGLAVWGGVAGFMVGIVLLSKHKKIQWRELSDYIVPSALLFSVFISLGGLLSGSFVGSTTSFPLSVLYAGIEGKRHMIGLYSALFYAIGTFISYRYIYAVRRGETVKGSVMLFGLWYFGLSHLLLDKVKEHTLYLFGLRFDSVIGFVLFFIIGLYFVHIYRKNIIDLISSYAKKIIIKANQRFKRKAFDETIGQ